MAQITTAMILAAGLGTRLKPFTDNHPKAIAVVNGKTLLQRNIEYLQQYGITNVVVNVHHFAKQIIDIVAANNGWGSTVHISDESAEVLETGGGLVFAKPFLEQETNFLLLNCDILTTLNIDSFFEYHSTHQAIATVAIAERVSSRNLIFNEELQLIGWRNNATGEVKMPTNHLSKKEEKSCAFSGVHILNSDVFNQIPFTGKFSMIDVYLHLCQHHIIKGYLHTNDLILDVGKPEALVKAAELFQ